jgi:hypothetical protein
MRDFPLAVKSECASSVPRSATIGALPIAGQQHLCVFLSNHPMPIARISPVRADARS